jgi:hypothetical protein
MGKFVVNIDEDLNDLPVGLGGYTELPKKKSRWKKIVLGVLATIVSFAIVASIGFFFYWQSLKLTPQYSLALIVDAAKRNDQAALNELVDIDVVVDDFLPQITEKAVELYGRGVSPDIIQRVSRVAAPVMPAVKDRAREELPGAIRQKTEKFGNVPFGAMVFGAEQYLDIKVEGENATVTSKLPEHNFEVRMKRSGDKWKIVGVTDKDLATRIAQRVGQEIIGIATNGPKPGQSKIGLKNINDLLKEAEEIFK